MRVWRVDVVFVVFPDLRHVYLRGSFTFKLVGYVGYGNTVMFKHNGVFWGRKNILQKTKDKGKRNNKITGIRV